MTDILWQAKPDRRDQSHIAAFAAKAGLPPDYWQLHKFSIKETETFWRQVAEYTEVRFHRPPSAIYTLPSAYSGLRGGRWFKDARLNFAENLLWQDDSKPAIIAHAEASPRRVFSYRELRKQVTRGARALQGLGVQRGDLVAGVVANIPEAIIAMLATTAIGATWSSCSPDFGASGILDRLRQVKPKVIFFSESYVYNGKAHVLRDTLTTVIKELSPGAAVGIRHTTLDRAPLPGQIDWEDFIACGIEKDTSGNDPAATSSFEYASTPFDHPLYVMFSSGTTGIPKCIVHSVGGTLLQHKKELMLHCDLHADERLLYFTTCGWMMWNWMVSGLSVGATLVLFEGSVTTQGMGTLWQCVDAEEVAIFGTSPKFLAACAKEGFRPRDHLQLLKLKTILSTGSPLVSEQFHWVYENVKEDLHLASISGGTDIIGCFMLGNVLLPVREGEIQAPGLGMAIAAWNDRGEAVVGEKGELVCTEPFVSMPTEFLGDPNGEKYRKAYFDHYGHDEHQGQREVWRHGDFIEVSEHGGIIVHGRSDATLNPGGVRIGTSEIYRQVEQEPLVQDSIAVGLEANGDTVIVLFVQMRPGATFDEALAKHLKTTIRHHLTPRHVPQLIAPVSAIPYTRSGKKVEMAVTEAIHGREVKNLGAIANPEALEEYVAWGNATRHS